MGPSTNVDGEADAARKAVDEESSLQWGRRRTSTERLNNPIALAKEPSLQWGRRRTSTESGRGARVALAVDDASMGPSTNVDGEFNRYATVALSIGKLQWGRRRTSTESTSARSTARS